MSDDAAPSAPMSDTDWTIVNGERFIKEISGATLKLPYEVINKAESMLHGALEELSRLVAAEDWDLLPRPLEDLENIIRMRIHPCAEVLQKLITLLYRLSTIEPFALPYVRSRAASLLALLLKKNKNTITKDFESFELDPTPLFRLIDSILFPPRRLPKSIPSSSTVGSLIFLARRSRRYFNRGCLKLIYEMLTADYDEFDPDRMARFVCQISIFNSPSTLPDLFKYIQPSSRVWAVNCKRLECLILHLLARYAKYSPNLDRLEEHDFAFYHSIIMRHLKLSQPEDNLQEKEKILYRHKTSVGAVKDQVGGAVKAFAKFIAHSLTKSAAGEENLRIFLCGMDSYFHPSNTGGWTNELSFFLLELCKGFAKIASKNQQDLKVSGGIAKVVAILWPAVTKLCFAKNPFVVLNAVTCAKYLLYLHADVLMEDILTTSDYTLSALSEPHRTLSCIALLSRTARLQIEGVLEDKDSTGVSILSLLPACVFGLDPNDPFKTATTLNLFASVFSCLRLHPHTLLSESFCEELITCILKQSFDYIESSATALHSEQATSLLEKAINEAFGHVWSLLFSQVSGSLWAFAFERVESFVMDPKGGAALASLLIRACKDGNAQKSFDRLFPVLAEKSDKLLVSGRGVDARQSDESCASLIWYLSCMLGLVRQSRDSALAHVASIKDLLSKFASLRQARCVQLAGKIIKVLSRSLVDYYPLPDSLSLTDPCGIAVPSVRISDANLTWHIPSQLGINLCHDLLSHFYSCCLSIICSDEKARMTFLHFLECIATSLLMQPASGSPLLQQCVTQLSMIAFGDTMSMEARQKALASLEKILSYRGAKESNLREYERSCKSWASQMESFPKEKILPLSIQTTRVFVCHRRWMSILGKKADIIPIVSNAQWINDCLKIALGPFSILRRNAQGILGVIFEAKPREFTHILTDQVLPLVRREPNENNLKGLFHMITSDYLPCRDQIISNVSLLFKFFEFCAQTLSLPEINSFIGVPELVSKCLSTVLFMYHPFGLDAWEKEVNVQNLIEASQGSAASWKLQLFTTILFGLLGDRDSDSKVSEEAAKFLLKAMTLEISQVRSIAVNRGISVLHRYYKQRLQIAFDVDEVDHYGADLPQPGNASETGVNAKSLELMAAEIMQIMPRLCHWLRLETNNTESTPSFRLDCAELFQTFAEISGPELCTRVWECLDTAMKDVSPYLQRARAEAYSGLCRGSTLRARGDFDTVGMATKMIAAMGQAGGECAWMWFEASRFMVDSLSPKRLLEIYKHALTALSYSDDLGQSSSATLGILLHFLAGYVRAGRPLATFVSDLRVKAYALMGTASDSTRRSAAFLTVYLMRHSATERDVNEIIGDYSVGRCKAFLTLIELMCLDPTRTGLWSRALTIVKILLRIGEKGEVELQRESRRVLRVLAWVALASPAAAITLITGIIRWLLCRDEPLPASSNKNALEFATLFYSRNFVVFQGDIARMLLKDSVNVAVGLDLESRRECANLLRLIFHGNPVLASEYGHGLMPKMKAAIGKIKEPLGLDERHVLVVTASSLILAFPYDIPSWMPGLLTLLTRFIHDRYPIHETAKNLFSEFKRTHGDSWQQDREKFTENELDAINELLVAPSYYA